MEILVVAPIFLHRDACAGGETINFYLDYLATRNHRVYTISQTLPAVKEKMAHCYLVSLDTSFRRRLEKLKKGWGWIFNPGQKYLYKTSACLRQAVFAQMKQMKEDRIQPQLIVLETVSAYLWIDEVRIMFPQAKIVADVHDIGYQGTYNRLRIENNPWKRYLRERFFHYAKRNEVAALTKVDFIIVQNPTNKGLLLKNQQLLEEKFVYISPYYTQGYKHNWQGNYDILFYGLMNRPENYMSALWFIDNVMPRLPAKFRFIVMGGKPVSELQARANERIIVTGFVSNEEVQENFEQAFCFACPLLFGSGIKTKLLTAFATGMPVLTNAIGIEGIAGKHEKDYFHCETAEEYSRYIQELADDNNLYHRMEQAALQVVDRDYNLSRSQEDYERALLALVNQGG